jgi:hypothetical protein
MFWKPDMHRVLQIGLTAALVGAGLAGCGEGRRDIYGPQTLASLKGASPEVRDFVGYGVQLQDGPMCKELGYTVDQDELIEQRLAAFAAAKHPDTDQAKLDGLIASAKKEWEAQYAARVKAPGEARTTKDFKAAIEGLYGYYDHWCAEAAASPTAGVAIKAPAGYDRKAAKAAVVAKVLKTAWIMQPQNQR